MIEFEKPMTCEEVSAKAGKTVSEEFLRAACHRAPQNHPLPHTRSGGKRPIIRIRWSQFVEWYGEEERFQVSA